MWISWKQVTKISVTYSKLNLDPPSNSTDRPGNEKSVPISDEIDAYCPALLIRYGLTIYIESKISWILNNEYILHLQADK